jgi:hypothetical protein
LADWAGESAEGEGKKERRATQPKTGLFSLRKRTATAAAALGGGAPATAPKVAPLRTSNSKLEVPDLGPPERSGSRPPALLSPPVTGREDHKGIIHNARDDLVKEAMKDTVKLQGLIDKAEKDRQVLRSKYESATSTAAFLKKRSEDVRRARVR